MDQGDNGREKAGVLKVSQKISTSKLVAVPSIPRRVKEDPVPEPAVATSLPTPPPSSFPTPSKDNAPTNERITQEIIFSVAHNILETLPSSNDPAPGLSKSSLDVYARPYVPSELRAINEEVPDDLIVTKTKHRIEFGAYTCKFAGSDFLSYQQFMDYDWCREDLLPATELTEQSCVRYFVSLLKQEHVAKEQENERHTLYKVPLQATPNLDGHCLWALSIPGLREDSPLIELGDTLEIRQLWVDYIGNPVPVSLLFQADSKPYIVYKSWTVRQFNASVYNVNRVSETVYLKANGLDHLSLQHGRNVLPIVVKVVFPLKQSLLQNQRRALLSCFRYLERDIQYQKDITNDPYGLPKSSTDLQSLSVPSVSFPTTQNDWIRRMLFPTKVYGRLQTQLRRAPHRALFDHAINYEQAHAVNSVCAVDYGTLPKSLAAHPEPEKRRHW